MEGKGASYRIPEIIRDGRAFLVETEDITSTAHMTTRLTVQKVYANCGYFGCMSGTHKNFDTCSCDAD